MSRNPSARARRRSSKAPKLPEPLSSALSRARNAPDDPEAWDELDEACRELDRPDEAAALYREVMASDAPADVRVMVGLRGADFCEEWFEDAEPVLEMLRGVLAVDPGHPDAFQRLTVLLTVSSRWDDLLAVYDAAIESEQDESKRAALLEEAAKVARDFASEAQRGSDYLKALLLLRLKDDQLASGLERRLDEQNRHQDLIDIWTARLSVLDQELALSTRVQIAERHLDKMGEGDKALRVVDDFVAEGGQHETACNLLDRISSREGIDQEVQREALERLDKLQTEAGNLPAVVTALERLLSLTQSDQERIAVHQRVGNLLETIERPEEALEHSAVVMRLDPDLDEARLQARGLAERVGAQKTYATALVTAADAASTGARRIELLMEAAALLGGPLAETEQAIGLYVRLFEDEAADDSTKLLATRHLTGLLEQSGDRERLLHFLEQRADLETQAENRKAVLGQAATLAESSGDAERALGLWGQRLEDDPSDEGALSARIVLFEQSSRHQGLVEALVARSRLGGEASNQRDDLVRAARVYEEGLGEIDAAISTWRSIEERFGRTYETIDQLIALLGRAQRFEEMAAVLTKSIDELPDEGEEAGRKIEQLSTLGDVQQWHMQELSLAIDSYARALSLSPHHERAQAGLYSLTQNEDCAHEASETLGRALHNAGEERRIVELLERRLEVAPDEKFKARILLDAADIEERHGDQVAALQATSRAFAFNPDDSIAVGLHRLGEETGDWQTVSEAYSSAIARSEDPERVRRLHIARGHVEEDKRQNPAAAAGAYRAAVDLDGSDGTAVRDLVRAAHAAQQFEEGAHGLVEGSRAHDELSEDLVAHAFQCTELHGRWDETLTALADKIAGTELSPKLGHDLKRQLAVWYRDAAGDPDSAELVLGRAVKDYPSEDTLRMLAELQRRAPGKPLVTTLLSLAEVTGGELGALHEAGDVALQQVQDQELAQPILEKALERAKERFTEANEPNPEGEPARVCAWAIDHLAQLCLQRDDHKGAVELLEESAQLPFSREERLARYFHAAEVASEGGFDHRAVRLGETVLEAAPHHEGAVQLLSSLHEKAGRLDELLALRRRELSLDRPLERRLFLRLDQSRVLGELGADAADRIEILRANFGDAPGHAETVEALRDLMVGQGDYHALASMLEEQAVAIAGSEVKRAADLWIDAGRIAENELGDLERLRANFKHAVAAHPTLPALDRLAELSRDRQEWGSEVSWLEQRLALTPSVDDAQWDPADRRRVVEHLGRALLRSEDYTTARELLEKELADDPAADASRKLLAELYRTLEEWQELATVLEGGVEYAPDDAASVEYLRQAARVERRRLGNIEGAIPLLEQAIALDDGDRSLRLLLADCLGEVGSYEKAREILTALLEEFGRRRTKERAHVHKQLARIARAMGEADEALQQAESAAKIERTSPGILMLLGQLARERGELDRAEQAYRTLALIVSRHPKSQEADDAEAVGESAILFELYQIATERGNAEQAKELLETALEVATRNQEESVRLADSLAALGKLDLLLDALAEQLAAGVEGAPRARLLVTRSTVLEMNERAEEAFEARLEALGETPADGKLVDSTRKLADKLGALERFWSELERLAAANESRPSVAGELWLRLGREAEAQGDLARAADLYERAQVTGHKPKRVFVALDRVLAQLQQKERILAALRHFVANEGAQDHPGTLADALYRLAEMELAAEDPAATSPEEQAAARDAGTEHLAQALELDRDDSRALAMLLPLAQGGAATPRMIEMLLRLAQSAGDDRTKLYAYVEASRLGEIAPETIKEGAQLARDMGEGRELRMLLSRLVDLLRTRGELEEAREALIERANLAEQDDDLRLMVELLEDAAKVHEGEERREIELRIAKTLSGPLSSPDRAIVVYERLLNDVPERRQVWQPLLGLYHQAGRVEEAARCIEGVQEFAETEEDRLALKMERIRLMVGQGELDEAEQRLRAVLEEHPDSEGAADVLVDLLRKAGRNDELKELLENLFNKARERGDEEQVARYGMELARLVEQEDRREAIGVLTAGLPYTRTNPAVLNMLLGLYTDEDDPNEQAGVLEHLLEIEKGDRARALALQLTSLREQQGDEYALGRALELSFAAVPGDDEIVARYIDHLRNQQDHGRLAETLMTRAEHTADDQLAANYFSEAGHLFEEELGDPAQAARAMRHAFARRPDDLDFLQKTIHYLVLAGEVDEALAILEETIRRGDELILGDALDLRARVLATERPDMVEALEQAHADLLAALEQLLPEEQEEDIQRRRVDVLERLRHLHGEQGNTEGERKAVIDLAHVYVSRQNVSAGVDVLADWLRERPEDREVASELGRLATEAGDHPSAMFAYERLFETSSGEERRDAVVALADAAGRSGDPMQAKEALESVFRDHPEDETLRERLRAMYEAAGAYEELAQVLEGEAEKTEDEGARFKLLIEAGDLHLKNDDGGRACELYEKARQIAPDPYLITTKLADAYLGMGDIERAKTVLDEAVAAHGKRRSPELSLLQQGLSRVAEASGDTDGMFTWLEAALMSDRNNGQVAAEMATRGQELGRYDIAIKALQILTLSKGDAPISKAEAYYRQGQIALEQGDEKKALLLARRAVSADGTFEPAQALAAQLGG